MKSRIPSKFLKKKGEDEEVQSDDEEVDGTSPAHTMSSDDKTGSTDISDLGTSSEAEDDGSVEVSGNQSLLLKLKNKINGLAKKGKKETAGDSSEEEGEAKAEGAGESAADALKKKKSLIIKIVIGAAVIGLLLHESPEEEKPAEEAATQAQKPKRNKEAHPTETAATETPAAKEATGTETPPVTETLPAVEETKAAPVETADLSKEAEATAPVAEPAATEPVIEAAPAVTETPTEPTAPDTTETPATVTPPGTEEITLDLEPEPTETPSTEAPAVSETSVDSVDGNVTESKGDDNLTDKILQDLEKEAKKSEVKNVKKDYVAPPDYEYTGRGLVYNCTGKHWACVDGPSYKSCEENSSSTKFLKKTAECYPFNVYQSQKGCESVQNRMVSSSAKTAFCAE